MASPYPNSNFYLSKNALKGRKQTWKFKWFDYLVCVCAHIYYHCVILMVSSNTWSKNQSFRQVLIATIEVKQLDPA